MEARRAKKGRGIKVRKRKMNEGAEERGVLTVFQGIKDKRGKSNTVLERAVLTQEKAHLLARDAGLRQVLSKHSPIYVEVLSRLPSTTESMLELTQFQDEVKQVAVGQGIAARGLIVMEHVAERKNIVQYTGVSGVLREWSEAKRMVGRGQSDEMYHISFPDFDFIIDVTELRGPASFTNHGCYPNCRSVHYELVNGYLLVFVEVLHDLKTN